MNSSQYKNTALITGASSGIGEALAYQLAGQNTNLVLVARREDRLQDVQKKCLALNARVKVSILPVDLLSLLEKKNDSYLLNSWIEKNSQTLSEVNILINNAGLALGTDKVDSSVADDKILSDWEVMLDTNVKALMFMTRALLPFLKKNNSKTSAQILNLGSVAGRWVYPSGAVYCASKFAIRAFSEGLRLDLMGSGIRVTNIEPGMVETEFSIVRLGDKAAADKIYDGMTPLSPKDIAETITWCLSRPPHINIQELVIFPTDQAGVGYVHRS